MPRFARILPVVFCLFLPCLAVASSAPDTVIADTTMVIDKPDSFRLTGTLTSIDQTDPPDFFDNLVAYAEYSGHYWYFTYSDRNLGWKISPSTTENGSVSTRISIAGIHLQGPHQTGAEIDSSFNELPFKKSDKVDIPFTDLNSDNPTAPVNITVSAHTRHPTTGREHYDVYSFRHQITVFDSHMITGPIEIVAKHVTSKADSVIGHALVMGSSSGSGSYVSYDAGTGRLTIHTGTLDILNSTGSFSAGIETPYLGDPVLDVSVPDIVLPFLGLTPNGAFRFGGSATQIVDPEGSLFFTGGFPEFRIRNTTLTGIFNSYAIYDSVSVIDYGTCPSAFLSDFSATDLMGTSDPFWSDSRGICLVFVTSQNLAALTAGFTISAFNVPATVATGEALNAPDPSGVIGDVKDDPSPLSRSFPNPFAGRTTIRYRVDDPGPVRIDIFEPSGRLVRRLVEIPSQAAGDHTITWDGSSDDGRRLPPGVYFYRITTGARRFSKEMILVR